MPSPPHAKKRPREAGDQPTAPPEAKKLTTPYTRGPLDLDARIGISCSVQEQHAFLDFAKELNFPGVRELVEQNGDYVNVQPAGRWSALHQACGHGDKETVQFLLIKGAVLSVTNSDGNTPRELAVLGGHGECVSLLDIRANKINSGLAIGIDLGTSFSSMSVWRSHLQRAEMIPNETGRHTTPSYVSFTDTHRHVGTAAKESAGRYLLAPASASHPPPPTSTHLQQCSQHPLQHQATHWPKVQRSGLNDPSLPFQHRLQRRR